MQYRPKRKPAATKRMNPFLAAQQSDVCNSTGQYIHVMELPVNPLIPSRYLLKVYKRKSTVEQWNPNQRVKYIENDEYPNWRESASVIEQFASVPSEGKGWWFELNNSHNGRI